MFWHNWKSKRKEINAENMVTLCNYKPKLTASLFSVPSSHSSCLIQGQCLCYATAERGTWHPQHPEMQESIWEGGEKSCSAGRAPLLQQPPWGWSLTPCSGQVMHCPAAIPISQSCPCRQFAPGFTAGSTAKAAPLEPTSSFLGSVCHMHGAKSTPRAKGTGADLGRMTELHQEGCSSLPCLLKPSSNTAQVQPVTALLWVLNHRNPGKQQETSKDEDGSAWPGALVRFVPLGCQLTPRSNSSQMEAELSGALPPVPQGRRAVLGSGTDHEDAVCSSVPGKMLQRWSNSALLAPVGWSIPGGRGCKCEITTDLRHRHAAKSTQVGVHNTSFHFNGIWHQIAVKPVGGDRFSLKKFIRL